MFVSYSGLYEVTFKCENKLYTYIYWWRNNNENPMIYKYNGKYNVKCKKKNTSRTNFKSSKQG